MNHEDFYIGWKDNPGVSGKSGRRFVIVSILAIFVFVIINSVSQQGFIESHFDYGNPTTLTGVLVDYPVYGVKTTWNDKELTVPIVGFGKFGAEKEIMGFLFENNLPSTGVRVKVTGTMIYYQDKAWMELTDGSKGIEIVSLEKVETEETVNLGGTKITGEIIDPKCFFGVMNPGYGKVHLSCAIRCISGGIPSILAVKEDDDYMDYYFILGKDGKPLSEEVLPYVGYQVIISGTVEKTGDLKSVRVDVNRPMEMISLSGPSICNSRQ